MPTPIQQTLGNLATYLYTFLDRPSKKSIKDHMRQTQRRLNDRQNTAPGGAIKNSLRGILFHRAKELDNGAEVDQYTHEFIKQVMAGDAFDKGSDEQAQASRLCAEFFEFGDLTDLNEQAKKNTIAGTYSQALDDAVEKAKNNQTQTRITDIHVLLFLEQLWRMKQKQAILDDTSDPLAQEKADQIKISPMMQEPGPLAVSINGTHPEDGSSVTMYLEPTHEGIRGWVTGQSATLSTTYGKDGKLSFDVTAGKDSIPAAFRSALAGLVAKFVGMASFIPGSSLKGKADDIKAWGKGWHRNLQNPMIMQASREREKGRFSDTLEITYRSNPGVKAALSSLKLANECLMRLEINTKKVDGSPNARSTGLDLMKKLNATAEGRNALAHNALIKKNSNHIMGEEPHGHTAGVSNGKLLASNHFTMAQHQAAMQGAVMADIAANPEKYEKDNLGKFAKEAYDNTRDAFIKKAGKSANVKELIPARLQGNLKGHFDAIIKNSAIMALARKWAAHDIKAKQGEELSNDDKKAQVNNLKSTLGLTDNLDILLGEIDAAGDQFMQAHHHDLQAHQGQQGPAPTPVYDALQSVVAGADGTVAEQLTAAGQAIAAAENTYRGAKETNKPAPGDSPIQVNQKNQQLAKADHSRLTTIQLACKQGVRSENTKLNEQIIQGANATVTATDARPDDGPRP